MSTACELSGKLRELLRIAERDPSMVGGTLKAFGPLLVEAADMIDDLGEKLAEAIRFWEENRAEAACLKEMLKGGSEHAAICVPVEAAKDAEIERLRSDYTALKSVYETTWLEKKEQEAMCAEIDELRRIRNALDGLLYDSGMSLDRTRAVLMAVKHGEDPVCGGPDAEVINRWCAYLRGET